MAINMFGRWRILLNGRIQLTLSIISVLCTLALNSADEEPVRISRKHDMGGIRGKQKPVLVQNAADVEEDPLKKFGEFYRFHSDVKVVIDSEDGPRLRHSGSSSTSSSTRHSHSKKTKHKHKHSKTKSSKSTKSSKAKSHHHHHSSDSHSHSGSESRSSYSHSHTHSHSGCDSASDTQSLDLSDSSDLPRCSDDPPEGPTRSPTQDPTRSPVGPPTRDPTRTPTQDPTPVPTGSPTSAPTGASQKPSVLPTVSPSPTVSSGPSPSPTASGVPSHAPTSTSPTARPSVAPSRSLAPTTASPTPAPTPSPTRAPTPLPTTPNPTAAPVVVTSNPTAAPVKTIVTSNPTAAPIVTSTCVDEIWVNELHYRGRGLDLTEFIEIGCTEGMDRTGFRLVFYDGGTGNEYKQTDISGNGSLSQNQNGVSVFNYLIFVFSDQTQDGPDGIAIVDGQNNVRQFVSYGRAFVALDGPAQGLTSSDLGIEEAADVSQTTSLQLGGTGFRYSDFQWQGSATATPGRVNTGQTFTACTGKNFLLANSGPEAPPLISLEETLALMFLRLLHDWEVIDMKTLWDP